MLKSVGVLADNRVEVRIDEYLTLWKQRVFIAPSAGPRFLHWAGRIWPNGGTARFYVGSGDQHVVPFLDVLREVRADGEAVFPEYRWGNGGLSLP